MAKLPVGAWVMAQKLPGPKQALDREAFLERVKGRVETPTIAGLPLIGLGGSCGKPCFQLPYRLTWNSENLDALEAVAREHDCFIEYGAYPHLKLNDGGQEVAAVQDWTTFSMVFMRPGYERGEELLSELARALEPIVVA